MRHKVTFSTQFPVKSVLKGKSRRIFDRRYTCIEREGEGWHFSNKYLSLLWEALKPSYFNCGSAFIYYIITIKSLFLIRKLGFLIIANRSDVTKLVTLRLDSKPVSVLCHMGDFGCGDGGWTPVMKIDGKMVCNN